MEKEFFTWSELLDADLEILGFGDCKMIRDFGPLKKGEKFSSIFFNYEEGICQAYLDIDYEEPTYEFKIGLRVV